MAKRHADRLSTGGVSASKRAKAKGAAEGPTSSARGNWIDKLDRAARRPLLQGDYMPASGKATAKRTSP